MILHEAVECYILSLKRVWSSLKGERSKDQLGNVRVGDLVKGLRGVPLLLWEHSSLSHDGVVLRDGSTKLTDLDCRVEDLLWLFLTGRYGNYEEIEVLREEMQKMYDMMGGCYLKGTEFIDSLDVRSTPVVSAMCAALIAMHGSYSTVRKFRYSGNVVWKHILDEILAIIVILPRLAGYILKKKYGLPPRAQDAASHPLHSGRQTAFSFSALVTEEIICRLRGCSLKDCKDVEDFINSYLILHADHGGGNASAHTARLVGSTHVSPFLALSASLLAFSGPLHGGANRDAYLWLQGLQRHVETHFQEHHADEKESVRQYTRRWLRLGRKVPGFGHAVLRQVDPRVTALLRFAQGHKDTFPSESTRFLRMALPAVSSVLGEEGKIRAPYPNVDAVSGVLLESILRSKGQERGIEETREMVADTGLLLFALGRSLGILTHLVLDRALGIPLERPDSLTLHQLRMVSKL